MATPSYLPKDTWQQAQADAFQDKADTAIWSLGFAQRAQSAISGLANLIKPPEFTPQAMPESEPLPIVVSERPDALAIQRQQQQRAVEMPTAANDPATIRQQSGNGTPAAMPSAGSAQGTSAADTGDLRSFARSEAVRLGIDPDIAERVAESEGGFDDPVRQSDVVYQGEREQSYGAYQLNVNGGLGNTALAQGIDPRNPAHARAGITFALEHAARNGWSAFHGAARVGVGERDGIGVAPQQVARQVGPQPTTPGPAEESGGAAAQADRYDVKFGFNQAYGGAQFNPSIPRHRGVDLQVRGADDGGRGSAVTAFQGGTVAAITKDPNGGTGIIIQDDEGLYHRYFHFDAINVEQGQRITAGQPIGVLGASGTEGFPHVHFEVSRGLNGDPMDALIDPTPYMRPRRQVQQQAGGAAGQPLAMASGDESLNTDAGASPSAPASDTSAGAAASSSAAPATTPPAPWLTEQGAGPVMMKAGEDDPYDSRQYDEGPREATPGSVGAQPLPQTANPMSYGPIEQAPAELGPEQPEDTIESRAGEAVRNALVPVYDAAGRLVSYVQRAADHLTEQVPAYGSGQTTTPTGEPDYVPQMRPRYESMARSAADTVVQNAERALPMIGQPNWVGAARAVGEFTEPMGGAMRQTARMEAISRQAATDLGMGAEAPIWQRERAVANAGWRAANPGLAQEYDELQSEFSLNIAGQVGDAPNSRSVQRATNTASQGAARVPVQPAAGDAGPGIGQALADGADEALAFSGPSSAAGRGIGSQIVADAGASIQGAVAGAAYSVGTGDEENIGRNMLIGSAGMPLAGRAVGRGMRNAGPGLRTGTVPPHVVDQMADTFPVRIPEDPRALAAIRAIGGKIDPEKGVDLYTTRAQGPNAAGQRATRGMVFYEAVPEGGASNFVRGNDDPTGVGGSQVIPATRTRFRAPLILSDAPGSDAGFNEAAQQFGIRADGPKWEVYDASSGLPHPQAYKSAKDAADAAEWLNASPSAINGVEQGPWAARKAESVSSYEIDRAIEHSRRAGPEGSKARADALREVVRKYGGDTDLIEPLLRVRGADASESVWAIKENIVSAHSRRNGHDGVITIEQEVPDAFVISQHSAVKALTGQKAVASLELLQAKRVGSPDVVEAAKRKYDAITAEMNKAKEIARAELSQPKITELADVREGANPTPGQPNPAIGQAQAAYQQAQSALESIRERIRVVDAEVNDAAAARDYSRARTLGSERQQLAAKSIVAQENANRALFDVSKAKQQPFVGDPGFTVRSDIPRPPGAQWSALPFDPASAAAGGAAGAAGSDEEADPLTSARNIAVAGILGNFAPRAAARWRQATTRATMQAAAARAAGKAPPATAGDWLRSVGYSGMIGPSTGIVNAVGNGMELLYHLPKDMMRSLARGAPREAWEEARGLTVGFMRAGGEVLDALAGAHPGGGVESARLSQRVTNPFAQMAANLIEAPTRVFSEVPDAFYRSVATSMGESRMAAQIATGEGLKGAAWSKRVNDLLSDVAAHRAGGAASAQTVDIIKDGVQLAERLTLRGDVGPRGRAVKDAFDALPFGLGNIVMPFFNTPYQMLQRQLERSPAGLRMGTQPAKFDKYYDAALGSSIALGAAGLAMGGMVTGSGPDDPEKKAMLRTQGWQANSTLVGGVWIPNNAFGVFGPMLDTAGEIGDAVRYQKKDDPNLGEALVKRTLRVVKNQVYLRGLSDLIKATEDPGSFGSSYAASLGSRLIPLGATARTVGNATDPLERQVDRSADVGFGEAVRQRVARGLPGQGLPLIGGREQLDPAQDVLGRPMENERTGLAALGPKTRTPKPDIAVQAFTDAGVDIGFPPDTITIDGVALELTPGEQRRWQRERGAILEKYAAGMTSKSWWDKPAARETAMKELLREANAGASGKVQQFIGAEALRTRLRAAAQKKAS